MNNSGLKQHCWIPWKTWIDNELFSKFMLLVALKHKKTKIWTVYKSFESANEFKKKNNLF